jgi:hypothetical protein
VFAAALTSFLGIGCERVTALPAAVVVAERRRANLERGYYPGNCRWETRKEQARNHRNTVWVEHEGHREKLADLCDRLNVDRGVVYGRVKMGWPIDRALALPVRAYAVG